MHSPQFSTMVDARVGVPCGWWYALKPHVSCLQYGGITLNVPTSNKLVQFRYRTCLVFVSKLTLLTPTSSFRGVQRATPRNPSTRIPWRRCHAVALTSVLLGASGEFVAILSGPSSGVIVRLVLSKLIAPIFQYLVSEGIAVSPADCTRTQERKSHVSCAFAITMGNILQPQLLLLMRKACSGIQKEFLLRSSFESTWYSCKLIEQYLHLVCRPLASPEQRCSSSSYGTLDQR